MVRLYLLLCTLLWCDLVKIQAANSNSDVTYSATREKSNNDNVRSIVLRYDNAPMIRIGNSYYSAYDIASYMSYVDRFEGNRAKFSSPREYCQHVLNRFILRKSIVKAAEIPVDIIDREIKKQMATGYTDEAILRCRIEDLVIEKLLSESNFLNNPRISSYKYYIATPETGPLVYDTLYRNNESAYKVYDILNVVFTNNSEDLKSFQSSMATSDDQISCMKNYMASNSILVRNKRLVTDFPDFIRSRLNSLEIGQVKYITTDNCTHAVLLQKVDDISNPDLWACYEYSETIVPKNFPYEPSVDNGFKKEAYKQIFDTEETFKSANDTAMSYKQEVGTTQIYKGKDETVSYVYLENIRKVTEDELRRVYDERLKNSVCGQYKSKQSVLNKQAIVDAFIRSGSMSSVDVSSDCLDMLEEYYKA